MFRHLMISLLVIAALASHALAGPLFRRPSKPDPAEYVPALIKTLQSDADEKKRESAAEELREFDLRPFPDATTVLIEALKNDPSHSVRHEVVNTIGKLRPISQTAGFALEEAATNDHSFRVRAAAKAVLVQWTLVLGYRQGRAPELNQTEEPPLAQPLTKPETKMVPASPVGAGAKDKSGATRPIPPLMPAQNKPSKSLFSIFSSKSNKPDDKVEGPALNPPK